MDEETQKIIEEQMKKLPADVKEAIISVDYQTKLAEIAKRHRLLIDQTGKLEMETTLVMIGLEPLSDYIDNLQTELDIPITRAQEIAVNVNEAIFKPIRSSLEAMETVEEEDISAPKFTNSNETSLNRDQILKEIEDPSLIDEGPKTVRTAPIVHPTNREQEESEKIPATEETQIEIRPAQEIQEANKGILQAKMSGNTITSQQIINASTEKKLPEIKKKPTSSVDPYREPLN